MNKKQLIVALLIILLLVIIFLLSSIASKLDNIDWVIRNILGKMNQ